MVQEKEKYQSKTHSKYGGLFSGKVWLTYLEHRGTYGVHGKYGHELDLRLKQECQKEYEKNHTREEFIRLIGKSYL